MPPPSTLALFALASLALAVVPGPAVTPAPLQRVWAQGAIVNVLNPKTALFFLAFLPQFVDPRRGSVAGQVALLGCLFVAIALTSDLTYALLADALASRLRRSARAERIRRFTTGGIFVALGATAAAARR